MGEREKKRTRRKGPRIYRREAIRWLCTQTGAEDDEGGGRLAASGGAAVCAPWVGFTGAPFHKVLAIFRGAELGNVGAGEQGRRKRNGKQGTGGGAAWAWSMRREA
jgi:hypothetical protein